MLFVIFFLVAGVVGGILLRTLAWLPKIAERLISITIYLLLFTLGMKAGADKHITSQLHTLGITALLISTFAIAGSIVIVWLVHKFLFRNQQP